MDRSRSESSSRVSRNRNHKGDLPFTERERISINEKIPAFIADEAEFVGSRITDTYESFFDIPYDSPPRSLRSRSRSKPRTTPGASINLNSEHFYQDLEEYVTEMAEHRRDINGSAAEMTEADLWVQLQQKESDLLLAAELGKALLENNKELTKQQERIAEEYSKKVEDLEQEKHLLRRRLDTTEGEYEARILELQNDIRELSSKIDSRQNNVKQNEREKTSLISELTAQNTRLTTQLKEASNTEALLTSQLQSLRDQCSMRKTSLQDHVSSLETLKDELSIMCNKKQELEKRLHMAFGDRDTLTSQLEEANDRIMALERQLKEQEMLYNNTLKELERLQRSHDTLAERLGGMSGDGGGGGARSLHAELDCDPDEGRGDDDDDVSDEDWIWKESLQVYKQLRVLVAQLQSNHDDDSGLHSDLSISSLDISECHQLRDESPEHKRLPHGKLRRGALRSACEEATHAATSLEGSRLREALAAAARRDHRKDQMLQERADLIAELQTKISVTDVELRTANDERARALADAAGSDLARDEAVARARSERDDADKRRHNVEVEFAKMKVELMQANGQLMEAVKQKIELGQQLEQWQMDMQELIDEHMRKRLSSQEKKRKLPANAAANSQTRTSRLLGFFQR